MSTFKIPKYKSEKPTEKPVNFPFLNKSILGQRTKQLILVNHGDSFPKKK